MAWLTNMLGRPLDLVAQIGVLTDIALWQDTLERSPLPDGSESAVDLLLKLARDGLPPAAELQAMATHLGVDGGRLKQTVADVQRLLESDDGEALKRLLLPLGELCSRDLAFTLGWRLGDLETSRSVRVDRLSLGLSGSLGFALNIDPCLQPDELPAPLPEGKRVLSLSLAGRLKAGVDAGLPIRFGTMDVSSTAQANTAFDFFFLNRQGMRLAGALRANLARLGSSPFDLQAIHERLRAGELLAVRLEAEGELSYGGRIGVAAPGQLLGNGLSLAKAGVGFSARRGGRFEYLLRADPDRADAVLVSLKRQASSRHESSTSFHLGLDFTQLYQRIQPLVMDNLGQAAGLLGGMQGLLQPSGLIREELGAWGKENLDKAWLKAIGPALLRADAQRTPTQVLQDALLRRIESSSAKWDPGLEDAAAQVAGYVARRLGVDEIAGVAVEDKLKEAALRALNKFSASVRGKLEDLVRGDGFHKVREALDGIGIKVSPRISNLERRVEVLRTLLQRHQQTLGRLVDVVESAAEAKLLFSLSRTSAESERQATDLVLRLHTDAQHMDAAQDALERVLTGSLDGVLDEDSPLRGSGAVELVSGLFQGFGAWRQSTDRELVLVDIALGRQSILSADTHYQVNDKGDVGILSRAVIEDRVRGYREGRELRFVEAYQLALASQVGSIGIGLNLSHKDQSLKPGEVEAFFGSLVAGEVLSGAAADNALAFLRDNPKAARQGELDVGLRLDHAQLSRVLGLGRSGNAVRAAILDLAYSELARAYRAASSGNDYRRVTRALPELGLPVPLAGTIAELDDTRFNQVMGAVNDAETPSGYGNEQQVFGDLRELNELQHRAHELAHALEAMRDIVQRSAADPQWCHAHCTDYQRSISEALHFWLKPKPGLFLLFDDDVRAYTIAFIRVLAGLAGLLGPNRRADIVTARMILRGDGRDRTVKLA